MSPLPFLHVVGNSFLYRRYIVHSENRNSFCCNSLLILALFLDEEQSFFLDRKYIRLGLGSLSLSEWSAVEALRARSTMTKLSTMTKSALSLSCSMPRELIIFHLQPTNTTDLYNTIAIESVSNKLNHPLSDPIIN